MVDGVAQVLARFAARRATLVAAVSGGADSVVLLDILNALRAPLALKLQVAHLDHGLRTASSADADFVERLSHTMGIPCVRETLEAGCLGGVGGASIENAARTARYKFLNRVATAVGARFVVLGHHADDQAETVLMRLLRGSGLTGLSGMPPLREGLYLRPLLARRRSEIESYAAQRGLEFRSDQTNADVRHFRNRIRHRLLPELRRHFNPGIVRTLCRTATVLKDEDEFVDESTRAALGRVVEKRRPGLAIITRARFEEQHLAIQRRILRGLLCELLGGAQRSFPRIEALVDAVASGHAGRRHLQSDLWYQVTADQLILRRGAPRNLAIEVALPGRTEIGELGLALEVGLASNTDLEAIKAGLSAERAAFDADRVGRRLQLRSARPGDRFQPLGMSGRKRVSEFLIDAGTPRILRDDVLLLTRGPEIVWVTGMRPAHPFRVQSGTRRVMIAQLLGRPDPEV